MKLPVTSAYVNPVIEPPLGEWPALLRTGSPAPPQSAEHPGPAILRSAARRRLVDAAQQFVMRLDSLAQAAGTRADRGLLTGDPDRQPIVMTGHQPVIFHSGLTFKYETTQSFAEQQGAICVAVVIDTDEGDGGQFVLPESAGSPEAESPQTSTDQRLPVMRLTTASLADPATLYLHQQLQPAAQIQDLAQGVTRRLTSLNAQPAARQTEQACQQYARLSAAGASLVEANLITRWHQGIGSGCLELPLSAISCFPEMLTLTAAVLNQASEFANHYNDLLEQFRDDHSIRNEANPFPNMQIHAEKVELPFWVLTDGGSGRDVLHVHDYRGGLDLFAGDKRLPAASSEPASPSPASASAGSSSPAGTRRVSAESLEQLVLQGIRLVPRGALITAFLRILFSDLFIHGTGGGKYDRFTDTLIRSWWQIEPTPYAVASASRYLFPDAHQRLLSLEQLSGQLRDLQFNPQRHFDSDMFSPDVEERLRQLTDRKHAAIERMKTARANGESAKEIGREIQELTDQIKSQVSDAFAEQLSDLEQLDASEQAAINCRLFPWFMFSPVSAD